MKNLLVAFIFCLYSTISNAEAVLTTKPVICDKTTTVFKTLKDDHKELPVLLAKDSSDDSRYSLFVNNNTGTWTFVQFTTEYACLIGFGNEIKLFLGEKV